MRLLVDGQPLAAPGFASLQIPAKAYDPTTTPLQPGLLYVRGRRIAGVGVSRVSDYIQPPKEILEEFLSHPKGL